MTLFYYFGVFLCGATSTFAMQKYGRSNRTYQSLFVYALATGIMSMGIFFAMTGFALELSGRALLYAAIYALFCLISYFTQLPAYQYLGISEVGVLSTCGRLILSMITGAILFQEKLSLIAILRMLLMLAAALLLFADGYRKTERNAQVEGAVEDGKPVEGDGHAQGEGVGKGKARLDRTKMIGIVLCLVLIAETTMAGIVSKYIAIDPLVPDASSLFFMTNLFVAVVSVVMLPILCRGKLSECVSEFRTIAPIQYLMILLSTASANISSLLSVLILAEDAFTLYVPLTGALGILSTEAVAVFLAHEKPRVIPVLLSCAAMLLAFFG